MLLVAGLPFTILYLKYCLLLVKDQMLHTFYNSMISIMLYVRNNMHVFVATLKFAIIRQSEIVEKYLPAEVFCYTIFFCLTHSVEDTCTLSVSIDCDDKTHGIIIKHN